MCRLAIGVTLAFAVVGCGVATPTSTLTPTATVVPAVTPRVTPSRQPRPTPSPTPSPTVRPLRTLPPRSSAPPIVVHSPPVLQWSVETEVLGGWLGTDPNEHFRGHVVIEISNTGSGWLRVDPGNSPPRRAKAFGYYGSIPDWIAPGATGYLIINASGPGTDSLTEAELELWTDPATWHFETRLEPPEVALTLQSAQWTDYSFGGSVVLKFTGPTPPENAKVTALGHTARGGYIYLIGRAHGGQVELSAIGDAPTRIYVAVSITSPTAPSQPLHVFPPTIPVSVLEPSESP